MKHLKIILPVCLCLGFSASFLAGQARILSDAWNDPQFVKQFTSSFLPTTEYEPKITSKEAQLFEQLAVLFGNSQLDEARTLLSDEISKLTEDTAASSALNYTLANLFLQSNRYEESINQYREAIRKFPNFRRAHKNLGLALVQASRFTEAIEALIKAIELGDGGGDTFGLLAHSYLNDDNATAALEGYRQASLLNPENKEWRIGKAQALMLTRRYEEAIPEFKQLIVEFPERAAFYTSTANAYMALNRIEEASRYLELLRRLGEADAAALALLGDIYINESLPQLAFSAYEDAIGNGGLSSNRALRSLRAFLQRGYYPQAESLIVVLEDRFGERLSNEEARELLNLRAQLFLALGQDEEAAGILERVLEEDPLNGNALMLLGDYNQRRGDQETAIYYFERALSISDFQREAQLQLARIFVQQKEYLKAIRQLEAVLALQYSANVADFLDAVRGIYNRSL